MTKEIARALFRPSAELSHMMAYNLRNLSGVCSVGLHVRIVSNGFTEIKGKLNGLIQKAERCVRPALSDGSRLYLNRPVWPSLFEFAPKGNVGSRTLC